MRVKQSRTLLAFLRPPFLKQIVLRSLSFTKQSNARVPLDTRLHTFPQLFWHAANSQTRARLNSYEQLPLYFPNSLNSSATAPAKELSSTGPVPKGWRPVPSSGDSPTASFPPSRDTGRLQDLTVYFFI